MIESPIKPIMSSSKIYKIKSKDTFKEERTSNHKSKMSKMIPNLPTFYWRRTLPRSDLADHFRHPICITGSASAC